MKASNRHSLVTLLAILCLGLALSASKLKLPAFARSAGMAIQEQPVVLANDGNGPAKEIAPRSGDDRSVSLRTDKMDYAPGEVVVITGWGWDPGEAVTLLLHEEPALHADRRVTVIADASGNIFDNQFVQDVHDRGVMLQLTARGRSSGLSTQAMFGNPSANLDQWANLPPIGTTGSTNWVNGNLGASKALYSEGDSIPYRLTFGSLSTSATHTVTIEWDTTKSSKHALDYITTFDRTPALPGGSLPNPCAGVSGCVSTSFSTFPIPDDPQVTGAGVTPIQDSVPVTDSKKFRLYGGTINSVGFPPPGPQFYGYVNGSRQS